MSRSRMEIFMYKTGGENTEIFDGVECMKAGVDCMWTGVVAFAMLHTLQTLGSFQKGCGEYFFRRR